LFNIKSKEKAIIALFNALALVFQANKRGSKLERWEWQG